MIGLALEFKWRQLSYVIILLVLQTGTNFLFSPYQSFVDPIYSVLAIQVLMILLFWTPKFYQKSIGFRYVFELPFKPVFQFGSFFLQILPLGHQSIILPNHRVAIIGHINRSECILKAAKFVLYFLVQFEIICSLLFYLDNYLIWCWLLSRSVGRIISLDDWIWVILMI